MNSLHMVVVTLGVVVGVVCSFYLCASVLRFAVRKVADFTPGYANLLMTFVAAFIMRAIAGAALLLLAAAITGAAYSIARWTLPYVMGITSYALFIKDKAGRSLGFGRAVFADLLSKVLIAIIALILLLCAFGVFGYGPTMSALNQTIRQIRDGMQKGCAEVAALTAPNPTPTPIPIQGGPSADQLLAMPGPGVPHYYLKNPLSVPVAYGQIAIPANTEVRLLSQKDDVCEIQIGDSSYTVSKEQLTVIMR